MPEFRPESTFRRYSMSYSHFCVCLHPHPIALFLFQEIQPDTAQNVCVFSSVSCPLMAFIFLEGNVLPPVKTVLIPQWKRFPASNSHVFIPVRIDRLWYRGRNLPRFSYNIDADSSQPSPSRMARLQPVYTIFYVILPRFASSMFKTQIPIVLAASRQHFLSPRKISPSKYRVLFSFRLAWFLFTCKTLRLSCLAFTVTHIKICIDIANKSEYYI